jgi:predicted phage-related endonuclease
MAKTKTGYSASRKNYKAQLVIERLTAQPTESYTNGAMQWGIDTEPLARVAYELSSGNDVEQTGFELHFELEAGASPDGLIGEDGLIEIKCPNSATHIEYLKAKELPSEYKAQVQGQLWITDRKWCDFVSYDPRMPEHLRMKIIRVERDEKYIDDLFREVLKFLEEVDEELAELANL